MYSFEDIREIFDQWFAHYTEHLSTQTVKFAMNPQRTEHEIRGLAYAAGMMNEIKEALLLDIKRREEDDDD